MIPFMSTKALRCISLMILATALNVAEAQELVVSDLHNSGCLNETRGDESQSVPTIVLTKDGSILSVELLNFEANCCIGGFHVASNINGEGDGEISPVTIRVNSFNEGFECDCICPYNISFTIHDLKPNSFYLDCWWYKGQIELTEGEPLVLADVRENVTVDGMNYVLQKAMHHAMLTRNDWSGELRIPSKLTYEGQTYTVTSIANDAFRDNTTLTKVTIPETVRKMGFEDAEGFYSNPFIGCTSLESIEVDENNPVLCAVDGVLFNKDRTKLFSYPAGARSTSYIVPESVTWVEGLAFAYNK